MIIGSLSNDDGDGNENGKKKNNKKTIGSDWQNNNSARACFFVHFSAFTTYPGYQRFFSRKCLILSR